MFGCSSTSFSSSSSSSSSSTPQVGNGLASTATNNGRSGFTFSSSGTSGSDSGRKPCRTRIKVFKNTSSRTTASSKQQKPQKSLYLEFEGLQDYVDEALLKLCGSDRPVEVKENVNGSPQMGQASNSPLPMTVISRILKGIPQNPHFLQLRCYSELGRENLIMAWDRTFEETAEQIRALRAGDDFWVRASKQWKTMEELQSLGYNVLVLRKRIVDLTDVMLKQKLCRDEINGLKNKAEFHRTEKSRLESVILNLQARVQRERDMVMEALNEVADKEKDLPKLEHVFATLAGEPLQV